MNILIIFPLAGIFLLQETASLPDSVPIWVTILLVILGAIGTFWGKIKSTLELKIKGEQELEIKKLDREHILEEQIKRLTASNLALSLGLSKHIDNLKESGDSELMVEMLESIIKKTFTDHFENGGTENKTQ